MRLYRLRSTKIVSSGLTRHEDNLANSERESFDEEILAGNGSRKETIIGLDLLGNNDVEYGMV